MDNEVLRLAAVSESEMPARLDVLGRRDTIAAYFTDPSSRKEVVDFFTSVTNSRSTALAILDGALSHRVPAGLAFALAYEESKFDPAAVGINSNSSDRGLFQLNSKSFPELSDKEAFDPARNARAGLGYLKNFLDSAGNEITALAMYNAGRTRVSQGETPRDTLDYISRILRYEENITSLFAAKVVAKTSLLGKVRFGLISGSNASAAR